MGKVDVMQEMYLIYQLMSSRLDNQEIFDEFRSEEINEAYRSFCQREPIGGMFLESVLEQLMEKVQDGKAI